MFKSKLSKIIVSLLRRIAGVTRSGAKRLMRAMLQTLMAMGRRARLPVAGFVLPTVTMVLLVVILLTVAITLRSFDRANTARNVRVNQQVLAAATPALDRAKAKIQFMLDQSQGRGTPSDEDLYLLIANPLTGGSATDYYTFGDEKRLKLQYNLDGTGGITPDLRVNAPNFNLETNESINTAWRYPVDTNNDGKFDTFTLYGIFFRTPPRDDNKSSPTVGEFLRPRKPLEARTPPMSVAGLNPKCLQGGGTAASLAGDSGWYRLDGKLKKSFFVYTVNVPITDTEATALGSNYQKFTGTSSISALEYQQDQIRIPIANNAVVYEDDLEISPGPPMNLNGRVFTNSNLLVSGAGSANSIKLYQVSSPESCFYEQENSKIVVAGNVVNGVSTDNTTKNAVDVHLYKKASLPSAGTRTAFMLGKKLEIKTSEESASNPTLDVLYNNEAYTKRLDLLVEAQMGQNGTNPETNDPLLVQQRPDTQDRKQALTEYFKQLTRKVPFAEVPLVGGDATAGYGLSWATPAGTPPILGTQDTLRPVDKWSLPNPGDTKINLKLNKLEATNPIPEPPTEEGFLGDRVVAGNNLPALRWDGAKFINTPETVAAKWNPADGGTTRERSPQVTKLADVGAIDRDGFWEKEGARFPENPLDGNGGLRVITGAGVYERKNSFLPPPRWINPANGNPVTGDTATYDDPTTTLEEKFPVVWPDSMPMSPLGQGSQVYDNSAGGAYADGNWINWPGAATALPAPPAGLPTGAVSPLDPNTPQYAKGDLRMRATVVYHYAHNFSAKGEFNDKPLACVSSYYDPSTASTARNLSTLPADVSGQPVGDPFGELGARGTQIGSNNGITYGPPPARPGASTLGANGLLRGGDAVLANQANLVFPDGRFANGPLREALQVADTNRTLAQKAAIDSTLCALGILKGTIAANPALIPHGAIREVAFLNGREIKAIDRDDWTTTNVNEAFTLSSPTTVGQAAKLTGNYNLPLEEREPLEIRATRIDLNVLRQKTPSVEGEPLLPNSGIIYATRDDALPDRSFRPALAAGGIDESRSETVSPTDSLLDPTRKPNGILLVNGRELARLPSPTTPTVADVVIEKGLTLASNLPVYIQGDFNLHSKQEFDPPGDWGSFYDRTNLDKNFACRPQDPRLAGNCTTGDSWRPANVLSDAVTLLSQNYRFGFRNEGDFDLRNNAGAAAVRPRKQQGFYSNNFVTNGLSSGAFTATSGKLVNTGGTAVTDANYANNNNPVNSSYFNNFVTPVQRRGAFPEYLMEVCNRIPVSACTDADWYVNPLPTAPKKAGTDITGADFIAGAGTTAIPPAPGLQRFPRRVAFKRGGTPRTSDALDTPTTPVPLGISGTGTSATVVSGPGANLTTANSLWFGTTAASGGTTVTYGSQNFPYVFNNAQKDGSGADLPALVSTATSADLTKSSQPLLMPVLQIQIVTAAPAAASSTSLPSGSNIVAGTGWIPKAVKTTSNMVVGSNDTPSRTLGSGVGDSNGGVQNLTRFLESWDGNVGSVIQGSFIQFNRSAYSTAPYIPILNPAAPQQTAQTKLRSLFDSSPNPPSTTITYTGGAPLPYYRTSNASITVSGNVVGRLPFFIPPLRDWGFDVGLLSQPPDLFTRKFTTPPSTPNPAEYFREVARNDDWVKTLMCGVLEADTTKKATETIPTADCL
ncbi:MULTISPECIES: hormogonium polysaccharide biosynthesis protein HpsA [unclassified Microcoleus]|uniref:hormogonium polysaccharide biosynthesis protein HpsA n=1 Tax=unclassified Microcoleus TaxID=2642155 RepID=UPI002FD2833F